MKKIFNYLKKIGAFIDNVTKHKALEHLEYEEKELINTFALLVAGSFVGIPASPVHISLSLLPDMENELQIMLEKVDAGNDPIGQLFSIYDIG